MRTETRKLFTVDDYYKMAEAGVLREPHRTELINGEIIEMTPMGSRQAAVVSRVNEVFISLFKGKALLRPQLPLRLNDFNEPEPDIVLLRPQKDSYSAAHPGPSDVFLVMEISDSSLRYDRDVKLPVYAEARLPEVWILDLAADALLVYRNATRRTYRTHLRFGRDESVSCLRFPQILIEIDELLGR